MQFQSLLVGQVLLIIFSAIFAAPVQDGGSNNSNAVLNESASLVNSVMDSKVNQVIQPETAKLETETSLPSAILNIFEESQRIASHSTNQVPVLDTIREDEKYGNNGEQSRDIGRAIVNGYEAFSNFLNALIDRPREIAKMITKSITDQLNNVGSHVVGLS